MKLRKNTCQAANRLDDLEQDHSGSQSRGTRIGFWRAVSPRATALVLIVTFLGLGLAMNNASACGWWGDGENDEGESIEIGADGRPVQETVPRFSIAPKIVERENGAGIAVHSPFRASRLAGGDDLKITDLKTAGFNTLVDLDGEGSEVQLHRRETETLGITYVNLPIPNILPSPDQMAAFTAIIKSQQNYPIAIYADESQTLAALWTMYRYKNTGDLKAACKEGRALGLSAANERYLRAQFKKKSAK